jgi:hypothetical protein
MDKTILSIILALFIIGMIAFSGARIRIHRMKSLACMMTVVCLNITSAAEPTSEYEPFANTDDNIKKADNTMFT